MFEIPVAGAGPAGLAAALTLPLFYMVRCGVEAGSLDQGLKRQALDHDIELRLGTVLAVSASGVRATGPRGSYAIVVGYLLSHYAPRCLDRGAVRPARSPGLRLCRDRGRPGDAGLLHLRRPRELPPLPGPHCRILSSTGGDRPGRRAAVRRHGK